MGIGRNQYIDLMNQCRSSKVRSAWPEGHNEFALILYVVHTFMKVSEVTEHWYHIQRNGSYIRASCGRMGG